MRRLTEFIFNDISEIMASGNITTQFSFTESDGVIISTQIFLVLITFLVIFLCFICRKRNELKHRNILPYIFNIGLWFYAIQTFISMWSFMRFIRKSGLNYG